VILPYAPEEVRDDEHDVAVLVAVPLPVWPAAARLLPEPCPAGGGRPHGGVGSWRSARGHRETRSHAGGQELVLLTDLEARGGVVSNAGGVEEEGASRHVDRAPGHFRSISALAQASIIDVTSLHGETLLFSKSLKG
jgi:hypothetical protein